MSSIELEKLRPEILSRIGKMEGESLLVVHRVLLEIEKEKLWGELSADFEADRQAGKFARLPEIIREARASLRSV